MQKIYNDIIKERIYLKKLANGLTVMLMPRANYNKFYGIFATDYGSIDNKFVNPETNEVVKVPDGIAHFLEHKLFESEEGDVFSKFARLGASANAFTNYNMTAYLFTTSSNFTEATMSLLDFVQDPYFTDENVEKEKGIIAQEIRMYDDEANYQVYANLLNGLYHHHPVKVDIAGTVESISKISKEDLYLCYNTFYNPGNMILFLTGDFNPVEILEKIEENQYRKELVNYNNIKRIYPEEPASIREKVIVNKMDVSEPLFRLGIKEKNLPEKGKELLKQELGTGLLLDLLIGKSSILYQDLYDQGLIDDYFSNYYVLEKGYGYVIMGGKTRDPELLYKKLLDGFKIGGRTLKKEDFNRAYKRVLGEYVQSFNSFEAVATEFISYYFKDISFFDILDIIEEIDLDYLNKRYVELFQENNYVRSVIEKI